jgi:hypothetical protein
MTGVAVNLPNVCGSTQAASNSHADAGTRETGTGTGTGETLNELKLPTSWSSPQTRDLTRKRATELAAFPNGMRSLCVLLENLSVVFDRAS